MSKLTPSQWREKTVRDLNKRRKEREKGIKAADSYLAECRINGSIAKNRIRSKCYK